MLAWYTQLSVNQLFSSVAMKNYQIDKSVVFKTKFDLKIPINVSQKKHYSPTKTYFWYLFLILYKKPFAKKFKWPAKLVYQYSKEDASPIKSLHSYSNRRAYHFVKYFFHQLNYLNFKPRRRVLKFQKNKMLINVWDSSYVPSFDKTKIIQNYTFPFIYLKVLAVNFFRSLSRHQVCSLVFLNIFQPKPPLQKTKQ